MFKLRNLAKYTIAPLVAIALGAMSFGLADAGTLSSSYSRPSSSFSSGGFRSADRPSSSYSYSKPPVSAAPAARSDDKPASVYSKPAPAYTPPTVADKPASTYSKPGAAPTSAPTTSAAAPSSNGYSKPGAAPTAVATATPKTYTPQVVDTKSVLGASSSKVMSNDALKKYQAERAAIKTPPQPVDVGALKRDPGFASATSRYGSVNGYMEARQTNITIYRNAHPNVYIYSSHMSPNYGAYDSSFLVGLMLGATGNMAANTEWMSAHQYDPWYASWHADMMRQAQDNADLRARLDAQDAALAQLKAAGAVASTTALPPGVDPSVAIAPEAMIANASVVQEEPAESHTGRNIGIVMILLVGGVLAYLYYAGSKK